eukprot:2345708-Pyramimonas_sp.AAC.1
MVKAIHQLAATEPQARLTVAPSDVPEAGVLYSNPDSTSLEVRIHPLGRESCTPGSEFNPPAAIPALWACLR